MKQTSLPTFTALSNAFNKASLALHPSEVHGLICGLLCALPDKESAWDKWSATQHELAPATQESLKELLDLSAKQLQELLFEFELLLPPDSNDLPERAEALTLWVQGFLTGLERGHVPLTGRETSEVTEAINDLLEITKMNYEEVVANEEDEMAYVELEEYVRMAVILIYEDLHETSVSKNDPQSAKQLH